MFSCVRYSVVYDVVLLLVYSFFFFFKQKTAYDMRISDWSSDVCSSDLKKRYSLLADATHPSPDPRKNTSLPHPGASHPQCGTTGLATPRRSFPACPDTRKRRSPARPDAPATRPLRHPPPFRPFPEARKGAVWGKRVSVRVAPGGRPIVQKKITKQSQSTIR